MNHLPKLHALAAEGNAAALLKAIEGNGVNVNEPHGRVSGQKRVYSYL